MKKMKFAAFAVAIVAALTVSAAAQQPTQAGALPDGKIAVINTSAFPSQISELKQKYEQVENQFRDRYQKLQADDQQMRQMESEIQTKGNALAPDKLRDLQQSYEDKKRQVTRDVEDLRADYNKALEASTKPIRDKLYQFMQTYASQRGIVLIIDLPGAAQTGSLAFVDPKTNITDDFISAYNRANPVPGAAPAGQPSAAQKPAAKP